MAGRRVPSSSSSSSHKFVRICGIIEGKVWLIGAVVCLLVALQL